MPLNNWLVNIQDWLLPSLCPACGATAEKGQGLCQGCAQTLPLLGNACPRCAKPHEHVHIHGDCGACQKRPPAFERSIALYRFAPPVDHFVREFKFHRQLGLARLLGEHLAERLANEPRPDRIIPIPLHHARLRERGYNQALEIARPVARAVDVPIDFHSLQRVRATLPQTGLAIAARRKNVRDAFRLRDSNSVRGQHLALMDDVMTTGSTAQAAAQCLRAGGADRVEIWVVARV